MSSRRRSLSVALTRSIVLLSPVGGEQRRVSIAHELGVRPRILLTDELSSALDVQSQRQLRRETVSVWQKTSLTIVLNTHRVDGAIVVGSRVVVSSPKPMNLLADMPVPFQNTVDVDSVEFITIHQQIVKLFGSSDGAIDELTGRTI